jgi:branched-subunit amino acid ABC-type transport system permease component
MQGFVHQLLSGLANGGIYASVALALVMIYQATQLVNFAQGEMAMFSTYIAWAMLDAGFPYWAAFGLKLVFSFIAGVAIERIIIRPVERGPVLTIVIVFIGLPLIAGWIFSYTIKSFPSPFPSSAWYGSKGALFIEFTPNFADQISKAAPDAIFGKFLIALMYLMPKGAIGVLDFIGVRLRRVAVAKRQN